MRRIALLCLALTVSPVTFASPRIWGELEHGPHQVGFRTITLWDTSRAPLVEQIASDPGRIVPIYVWYPAEAGERKHLTFSHYTSLMIDRLVRQPTGASIERGWREFADHTRELAVEGKSSIDEARELLADLEMAAVADAPLARGRYPLVVFPGHAATNCILGEHLASHGYVVVSTPTYGSFDKDWDISSIGIETTTRDINFIVGEAGRMDGVDSSRVAVMGLGVNANTAVVAAMRTPRIDAVISLEGGLASPWESRVMTEVSMYDINALRQPLLVITAPYPSRDLELLDRYRYSTRTVLEFPTMSEFHFLSWGMLESFSPGILGKPPGDTKAGFEWGSRYVRLFLDATLVRSSNAIERLRRSPAELGAPDGLIQRSEIAALPAVPTFAEAKQLILAAGPSALTERYEAVRTKDPQPFSPEMLGNLNTFFAWQRDDDLAIRLAIAGIWVASYPDSAQAHFRMAQTLRAADRLAESIRPYERVLELLDSDTSAWVIENGAAMIRDTVVERVKEIKASLK